ncbi:MAG: hypothetical protein JSV91_10805 [Phycisphaerales bacterium]|nr:MAG: hypothetical protein JSV91_10805 [Phycisphaerales bacterium]
MVDYVNELGRRRGRGIRPWLILAKLIGLFCFIGGLAAAAGLACGSPAPADRAEWKLAAEYLHWIIIPGMVGGGILALAAGGCLWLQMPRVFLRMRWFKVKIPLVVVLVGGFHLWGRFTARLLHEALDKPARIAEVPLIWDRLSLILLLAFFAMLPIVYFGRVKPRLGQPIGPAGKRNGNNDDSV